MSPSRRREPSVPIARPADVSGQRNTRCDSPAFVLFVYVGIALLMTFPLALHWRSALPAGGADLWLNYWNFWWWKQSLLEWRSPLAWSPMLFHPLGVELRCHTHSAFNQMLAMPVNLVAGEAAAHNFCVFFQFTLSAFAAWLLVRDLTGNARAALLSGLIFAFFPHMMEQSLEHLNLISTGFMPLALLFLLRWHRSRRLGDALGLGACFGFCALCSWHLGILCSLVVVPAMIWFGWEAWRANAWPAYLRGAAAAAATAALLALPFAPLDGLVGANGCLKWPADRGIDPTYLLTPHYANPVAGPLVSERYAHRPYGIGFVCYLGFAPLGLAALAVWARLRRCATPPLRGWLVLFAGALVLALGSRLIWDNVVREGVLLPFFAIFRKLPVLEHIRVAHRLMVLVGLALAVLAGHGAAFAFAALRPGWRRWALPLTAILLLAEYSWLPYPILPVEHSPLLKEIRARPGAVLSVPFLQRPREVRNQVAQTVHGRPIAGGYLSIPHHPLREFYLTEPALAAFAKTPPAGARVDVPRLRELGFATLVIHKQSRESVREEALKRIRRTDILAFRPATVLGGVPDSTIAGIRRQLDQVLGGAALEDDRLAVYFLDDS